MNLIEMRKGVWQLSENDFVVAAVHLAHVVTMHIEKVRAFTIIVDVQAQ